MKSKQDKTAAEEAQEQELLKSFAAADDAAASAPKGKSLPTEFLNTDIAKATPVTGIQVRAMTNGYVGDKYIRAGETFTIANEAQFSGKWMERI